MQPCYTGRLRLLPVLFVTAAVLGCGGGSGSTSSDGGVAVDPAATPSPAPSPTPAPAPAPAAAGTYDTRVGLGADATGIPTLTKHASAQYIYWNPAHANASDSNAGTDPSRPKASLASAWSALRDGYGDWLLMASGSTYSEGFGQLAARNGLSAQYPIVVTTYDTTDPTNTAKMRQGMVTIGTNPSSAVVLNIFDNAGARTVFENILFDKRNSSEAQVMALGPIKRDLMFYNVRFNRTSVAFQGDFAGTASDRLVSNIVFRRCVFAYGYSGGGHSQGMYLWATDGVTVEDSIFYHNGWQGTNRDASSDPPDMFKHNAYFGTMTFNTIFRRNVSAAASSHGLQARGGGTIEDNVFAKNPLNMLIGGGDEYNVIRPTGVPYSVKRNVVVGSDNIDANNPRGFGIDFINTATGGAASDNLVVNAGTMSPSTSNQYAFAPHTQLDAPTVVNWTNNIVWNWGPNSLQTAISELNRYPAKLSLTMSGNVLPNDTPTGTNVKVPAVSFPDPSRTIASYAAANGYASEQAFWDYMIQHPESNWAQILADYIRAGFVSY